MRAVLFLAILVATPVAASAGDIEKACLKSERAAGNRALCGCIQRAADVTLTNRDQKLAASFFAEPDKAEGVRRSDSRRNDAFWERYLAFGETAEAFCASS